MELGICFLGSLRNNISRVDELLKLPEYVVPLYGLAVGYPDHQPETKPRLPFEAVFHENKYEENKTEELLKAYDETMQVYYQARTTNKKIDNWTDQMKTKFSVPTRVDVAPYVLEKKLNRH
jgi:FMN reductase (NADPH)